MKYVYFEPASLHKLIEECKSLFENDETGIILSFPNSGLVWRIDQILRDYSYLFSMPIIKMQSDSSLFDSKEDLYNYILQHTGKTGSVGIFVTHMELDIRGGNFHIIQWLGEICRENTNFHMIYLYEMDITNPEIAKMFREMSIFANIRYFSLFSREEITRFTEYLCKKWNIKINRKLLQEICEVCGGHVWLVKEAVRLLKLKKSKSINEIIASDTIQLKVEQIHSTLLESEKLLLRKIITSTKQDLTIAEKHSKKHLTKVGLLNRNIIQIPLLEDFIRKTLPKVSIQLKDSRIEINGIVVNSGFSRKQLRILRFLLSKNSEIVSRDELAKVIWPDNTMEYYTDWALDRIISRLRENIASLGIDKNLIQTYRRKGYKINSSF